MSDVPLHVSAHETGRLRLFAISDDDAGRELRAAAAEGDAAALAGALGVEHVESDRVTLLASADIADLGLRSYLAQGYDVPREQLDAAGPQLDGAPAHLLLVPSSAFGDREHTLAPGPALRPLASFDLNERVPPRGPTPRYSEPEATLDGGAAASAPRRRTRGWLIAGILALVVLVVLGWVLVLGWAQS